MQKKERKEKEASHGQLHTVDAYLWSLHMYAEPMFCLGILCVTFSKHKIQVKIACRE